MLMRVKTSDAWFALNIGYEGTIDYKLVDEG
jgi:hypothetical protein